MGKGVPGERALNGRRGLLASLIQAAPTSKFTHGRETDDRLHRTMRTSVSSSARRTESNQPSPASMLSVSDETNTLKISRKSRFERFLQPVRDCSLFRDMTNEDELFSVGHVRSPSQGRSFEHLPNHTLAQYCEETTHRSGRDPSEAEEQRWPSFRSLPLRATRSIVGPTASTRMRNSAGAEHRPPKLEVCYHVSGPLGAKGTPRAGGVVGSSPKLGCVAAALNERCQDGGSDADCRARRRARWQRDASGQGTAARSCSARFRQRRTSEFTRTQARAVPVFCSVASHANAVLRETLSMLESGATAEIDQGGEIDLYWLPLGAGGHFVKYNGRERVDQGPP